jgi:hypothetical protein
LVLVRALAERLGLPALLEEITIKQQERGYSPAQAILGLCETLVARALDHAFCAGHEASSAGTGRRARQPRQSPVGTA